MKKIIILILFFITSISYAEELILLGTSSQKWMFIFDKYDAKLWGEKRGTDNDQELVLEFSFKRTIDGKKIGLDAIKELTKQNVNESLIIRWTPFISTVFPDVTDGDRVKITYNPRTGITVHLNDVFRLGQQSDKVFSRMFMGIWLSPNASNKAMRKELLGL